MHSINDYLAGVTFNARFAVLYGTLESVYRSHIMEMVSIMGSISDPRHGDGWIEIDRAITHKMTGITPQQQSKVIRRLKKLQLIETKTFGDPARRYVRMARGEKNDSE